MIEAEVQNETHQTTFTLKLVCVPRIGEGIRLMEPDGDWASYDVIDVWYQKAEYGDVWVPYLHVRLTPDEMRALDSDTANPLVNRSQAVPIEDFLRKFEGNEDHRPTEINLDLDPRSETV
ncbi:hypothetical protein [Qipengyuania sp. MTN3-11]|uniref:hypothetical protein n=1 Tax=Qipengyuania sp. MTN3-11 TaxID=3056557 RepID=UPI0036F1FA8C